jgi:hypothetical protein
MRGSEHPPSVDRQGEEVGRASRMSAPGLGVGPEVSGLGPGGSFLLTSLLPDKDGLACEEPRACRPWDLSLVAVDSSVWVPVVACLAFQLRRPWVRSSWCRPGRILFLRLWTAHAYSRARMVHLAEVGGYSGPGTLRPLRCTSASFSL